MIVSNEIVSRALAAAWSDYFQYKSMSNKEWRTARNAWLIEQGIGGVVKSGRQRKYFPSWWTPDTEFWFYDSEKAVVFVLKWS